MPRKIGLLDLNFSCVYMLINTMNGKYYIGSTKNFRKRKNTYNKSIRNKKSLNKKIWFDINRYGWDCFKFIILKKVESNTRIIEEKRFIELFNSLNENFGYNSCDADESFKPYGKQSDEMIKKRVDARRGYVHSEETKNKIGIANKGKFNYFKDKKRPDQSVIIKQYDRNGIFINEFESITYASKITGINKGHISNVYRGVRKTAGNYIWK